MTARTEEETLVIEYEVQPAQINAGTLLGSLLNLVGLIEEINSEILPEQKINVSISAFAPGSFEVVTRISGFMNRLFKSAQDNIKKVISVFEDVIKVKKILGGEKPSEVKTKGNKVYISNFKGQTITISITAYNIYATNPAVSKYLKNSFEPIMEDPSVDGVVFKHQGEFVEVTKEELPLMTKDNPLLEEKKETEVVDAVVVPVKIVFQEGRKWEFIYEGNRISAYILDNEFYKKMDTMRFGKGDKLHVKLEIEKVFDRKLKTYLIKEYRILKVINYEKTPTQTTLFDKKD